MPLAYVALGSNLDHPSYQIETALIELEKISDGNFKRAECVQSPPMGGPPQEDYLNTVCSFECSKDAHTLLRSLQLIEAKHGRRRDVHWGPRTLDLDLLLFGREVMQSSDLQLPHPGIREREFVLVPLLELDPHCREPETELPYQNYLDRLLSQQESQIKTFAQQ